MTRLLEHTVALSQFLLSVLRFSPVSRIPPLFYTNSFAYMLLLPGQTAEAFQKALLFWISGSVGQQSTFCVPYRVHACGHTARINRNTWWVAGLHVSCPESYSLSLSLSRIHLSTVFALFVSSLTNCTAITARHLVSLISLWTFLTSLIRNVKHSHGMYDAWATLPTAICIGALHGASYTVHLTLGTYFKVLQTKNAKINLNIYRKTQSVPRSKHSPSPLQKPVS